MWNREELKSNAKSVLRRNFWVAFLVCLIVTLLSGEAGNNGVNASTTNTSNVVVDEGVHWMLNLLPWNLANVAESSIAAFFGGLIIVLLIASLCFSILVLNPLIVGKKRYFIESIENRSQIGSMFRVFTDGNYWNIVKIMLLMDIKLMLWTLCFIIPGIIKGYEYYLISSILGDDGSLSSSEVFAKAKEMSNTHKFDFFILDLSFLGWDILCGFTLGIGYLFLAPYKEATHAELYYASKEFLLYDK